MKGTGQTLNMGRIKLLTVVAILAVAALVFWGFNHMLPESRTDSASLDIVQRWELPSVLREISGIAWLDKDKVAAVQDENGVIFIYDLKQKSVTKEIAFAGGGDYEGLAINGKDAYVLRSDGTIFEIKDYASDGREVATYDTRFNSDNNMETLEFDKGNNRLLIAPKDHDPNSDRSKGVYVFSLEDKKVFSEADFIIDMGDRKLKRFRENNLWKTFRPSDLAIHPKTNEIYVLEGAKPKLLILDADGTPKNAYTLGENLFPQPEGITFAPDGRLYIASEGKKQGFGTITELKLHR